MQSFVLSLLVLLSSTHAQSSSPPADNYKVIGGDNALAIYTVLYSAGASVVRDTVEADTISCKYTVDTPPDTSQAFCRIQQQAKTIQIEGTDALRLTGLIHTVYKGDGPCSTSMPSLCLTTIKDLSCSSIELFAPGGGLFRRFSCVFEGN